MSTHVDSSHVFTCRLFTCLHRFLPAFFGLGAALEFSMINWTVGETNFYSVYKKRQALDHLEEKKHQEAL